jgi:hypothetical protein
MKNSLFIILLLSNRLFGQDTIYKNKMNFVFSAIFIDNTKDTITKETIVLSPTCKPWIDKSQKAVVFLHSPDIEGLKKFCDPVNSRQKDKVKHPSWPWTINYKTGMIETENEIWMHPFRANQYVSTEVAPFPEVKINLSKPITNWSTELNILLGWDNFKGVVKSDYKLVDTNIVFLLKGEILHNCWSYKAVASHSLLGKSTLLFIFHKKYGFLKFDYEFYDQTKISIQMIDVFSNN